jgi:hypothetical protein
MSDLKCIEKINESINELKTYRQFSGRTIYFGFSLNDQEIKNVLDNINLNHQDVNIEFIPVRTGCAKFRFTLND